MKTKAENIDGTKGVAMASVVGNIMIATDFAKQLRKTSKNLCGSQEMLVAAKIIERLSAGLNWAQMGLAMEGKREEITQINAFLNGTKSTRIKF